MKRLPSESKRRENTALGDEWAGLKQYDANFVECGSTTFLNCILGAYYCTSSGCRT